MRRWLLARPVPRALVRGLVYAALSTALYPFAALDWDPVGWVVVGYVAFGLGLGACAERVLRDHYAQSAAALDGLGEAEQDEAVRAIWRGPLPIDPRVREATVVLAGLQLKRSYLRIWSAFFLPLYVLRWTHRALSETPLAWVPVAVALVAGISAVVLHRTLRRRLTALDPDGAWVDI